MKRDLFVEFRKWRTSESRKPLILRGARQVGKSWLVRAFGQEFDHFIEINFDGEKKAKEWFSQDLDVSRILQTISLNRNKKIIPGKTLLFFDEIQECEDAIRSLRYFKEVMPELHVIAAGSLLGFAIEHIGIPVGRVQFLYLYPLSFMEFLSALGREDLREFIKSQKNELSIHQLLLDYLKTYMFLGGMPAVVHEWLKNQDVRECQKIQDELLEAFRQDFHKYAKDRQIPHVTRVFENIPKQLGKRFMYSNIDTDVRSMYYREALSLLQKAGVVHLCYHTSALSQPLGSESNEKKFKAFFFDIGLAQRLLGFDAADWFSNPVKWSNAGHIAEQLVAEELIAYAEAHKKAELFYWHREEKNSNAEVDFVTLKNGFIIPIEVKSSVKGRLRSLNLFLERSTNSPYGLKISEGPFSKHQNLIEIPFYAIQSWMANPS